MLSRTLFIILFLILHFGFSQSADSLQSGETRPDQTADSTQSPELQRVQSPDSLKSAEIKQIQSGDTLKSREMQRILSADSAAMAETNRITNVDSLHRAEMKKLHFLKGQWKGEAWIMTQSQEKQYIIQTENVELKQNGLVLTIQGTGIDKESLTTKPRMVHDAYAILYFDKERCYENEQNISGGFNDVAFSF